MALNEPVLSGPGAGRTVTYGGGSSAELKLAGEQSGGDWAVVEWRVRAGDEPPIHTHTREDETLYVLEGAITAYVGDETIEVEAGSYAALPKNVPHGLTVRGEEARLLVTLEPAGAEYLFVPRDDSDNDPAKFGLIIHAAAHGGVTQLAGLRRRLTLDHRRTLGGGGRAPARPPPSTFRTPGGGVTPDRPRRFVDHGALLNRGPTAAHCS